MSNIEPKLAKTSMEDLDKSKTLFLKATLGVSKYTSNTFVLTLTREKTLCEDLHEMGYHFNETVWKEYKETIEAKRTKCQNEDFSEGPAFKGETWREANQKNRALICRTTYHGFHHKICQREDFFESESDLCTCKYCGMKRMDRHHILKCIYFRNRTIRSIVDEISNTCGSTAK